MQISTHGVMTIPQELGNLPSFDHGIYDDNYWLQLVNKPIRETHTIWGDSPNLLHTSILLGEIPK